MPSTHEKQRRKEHLQRYREGYLSEKSKKALGFPPGPIDFDFQPHYELAEYLASKQPAKKAPPPEPKQTKEV